MKKFKFKVRWSKLCKKWLDLKGLMAYTPITMDTHTGIQWYKNDAIHKIHTKSIKEKKQRKTYGT